MLFQRFDVTYKPYISIQITLGRWCSRRNITFTLKDNRSVLSAHLCHWRDRSKPLVKQVVHTHIHQTHCATLMDRVYSCGRWMTLIARVPRGFRHGFVTRRKYRQSCNAMTMRDLDKILNKKPANLSALNFVAILKLKFSLKSCLEL